jgi:DNA (cytosine-5)-methyltransferase 1
MRHGSLFSGIGGFDLSAQWVGWENVFQVEIDDYCTKVLEKNFPNAKRYRDIREFDGTQYRGTIDVVSGGFPCQPFSQAGQRRGKADERYLWEEMLRAIREIQPTWIVAENVSGLLIMQDGLVFEQVCTDLEKADYEVQPFIIPACAKNAPHRRDRIWIIANSRHRDAQRTTNQEKHAEQDRSRNAVKPERPIKGDGVRIDTNNAERFNGTYNTKQKERQVSELGKGISDSTTSNTDNARNRTRKNRDNENGKKKIKGRKNFTQQGKKSYDKQLYGCNREWDRNWIEVATELCGVPNRVSNRVHRLKGLGNAIVPAIAFELFRAINEIENEKL